MAGAVGIEPTTRGFGVDVKHQITAQNLRIQAAFKSIKNILLLFDAMLMLYPSQLFTCQTNYNIRCYTFAYMLKYCYYQDKGVYGLNHGVKFYSSNDMSCGHNLTEAEQIILSFNENTIYSDINKIIELFNIKCFFDNNIYLTAWTETTLKKYSTIVKSFGKTIGLFFSKINDSNIANIYNQVDRLYKSDFWNLIEYHNVYKRISFAQVSEILSQHLSAMSELLYHKKIVYFYDDDLANVLTTNVRYAELVISAYVLRQNKNSKKYFLPSALTNENKKTILKNYIIWEKANPNYLKLLATLKKCDGFITDDAIRYSAHKRYQEYWANATNDPSFKLLTYKVSVSFYDDSTAAPTQKAPSDENTLSLSYGITWIKENLDFPTLLNNFIYLFGYVDHQFRCQYLANPTKLGVLERFLGLDSDRTYRTGIDYDLQRLSSVQQMIGYLEILEKHDIKIEEIFKWFFEIYLPNEFSVKGFVYVTPSQNASLLEKILILITQIDSVIKQFNLYVENSLVDREYFEFSSSLYKISDTPSIVNDKYIYPNSNNIKTAMELMFSDQSMLYYTEKTGEKYTNLPELLFNENFSIEDFESYNHNNITWLLDNNYTFINDTGYLKIDKYIAYFLKDLYENGVVSYSYYKQHLPKIKPKLESWIDNNDLKIKNTLFTEQEQNYIDYMLNVQQFNNGPELRNRYVHGTFPLEEKNQEQDYIELLKIMVLIIIKINEEFCLKFPI